MTLVFILRFMLILLAMLAAGAAGFVYARNQAELSKMRRRTSHAESEAELARTRLSQEKRRNRRA